jgi:hypothetical protein
MVMYSGGSVTSRDARLDRSCSIVRAPISVDVIAGRLRTQASATWAEVSSVEPVDVYVVGLQAPE